MSASTVMKGWKYDGVPMSASHTGLSQVRRLHLHGRRVRLLPTARDLDTHADLESTAAPARQPA